MRKLNAVRRYRPYVDNGHLFIGGGIKRPSVSKGKIYVGGSIKRLRRKARKGKRRGQIGGGLGTVLSQLTAGLVGPVIKLLS